MSDKQTILVTTAKYVTPYLEKEIRELGYEPEVVRATGVEFKGTKEDCLRLNLHLRTAYRVLWLMDEFEANDLEELYNNALEVDWENWIDPFEGYVSLQTSVFQDGINDTRMPSLKCKDAIMDRMREVYDVRPDAGPDTDKSVIYLYWSRNQVRLFADTSGTPLNRRGYRLDPFKAPMQETLAAAVLMETIWREGRNVVNPMCGSGTLIIEALLRASHIAPGTLRDNFGFMHLKPFEDLDWDTMVEEAKSKEIKVPDGMFVASDRDRKAISAAKENAERAGVGQNILFRTCDFRDTMIPKGRGIVILNPEYGLRLGEEYKLERVYSGIGDFFKHRCKGYRCYVFTGNLNLAKKVGLSTEKRTPFYNADVECRLLEYQVY